MMGPMITRRSLGVCALALPMLGGTGSSNPVAASQSPKLEEKDVAYARGADLKKLEEWVTLEQSFTDARRANALQAIAGHRKNETEFSEAAFYMEVRRIVGLADNGHSNVTNSPIRETFGLIPLSAYWFSDGLHIVRAPKPHEHLLGARVDAINGRAVGDLEALLMKYSSGTAEYFRRYAAPLLMFSPALLHAIGLSERPDRLELRLTSRAGERLEVELDIDLDASRARASPWRYLHPAPIEEQKGWSTVHDDAEALPLYLQAEEELFRYVLLEDGAVVYIQLRSNKGPDDNSVRTFVAQARKRLERDRPHSIILDNRHNPGGDLGLAADFALALPSLAKPDGRVYVITGNATFSAGIYTSFFPEAADAERTVIVGEHVGDRARIWSESGPPFRLPDSGYYIGYALKMHDPGAGCHDREVCHLARGSFPARWNIAVGSLEPEWPVPASFVDFEAGRDRALERILAAAAERRAAPRQ
jgi:hypothetical protein